MTQGYTASTAGAGEPGNSPQTGGSFVVDSRVFVVGGTGRGEPSGRHKIAFCSTRAALCETASRGPQGSFMWWRDVAEWFRVAVELSVSLKTRTLVCHARTLTLTRAGVSWAAGSASCMITSRLAFPLTCVGASWPRWTQAHSPAYGRDLQDAAAPRRAHLRMSRPTPEHHDAGSRRRTHPERLDHRQHYMRLGDDAGGHRVHAMGGTTAQPCHGRHCRTPRGPWAVDNDPGLLRHCPRQSYA